MRLNATILKWQARLMAALFCFLQVAPAATALPTVSTVSVDRIRDVHLGKAAVDTEVDALARIQNLLERLQQKPPSKRLVLFIDQAAVAADPIAGARAVELIAAQTERIPNLELVWLEAPKGGETVVTVDEAVAHITEINSRVTAVVNQAGDDTPWIRAVWFNDVLPVDALDAAVTAYQQAQIKKAQDSVGRPMQGAIADPDKTAEELRAMIPSQKNSNALRDNPRSRSVVEMTQQRGAAIIENYWSKVEARLVPELVEKLFEEGFEGEALKIELERQLESAYLALADPVLYFRWMNATVRSREDYVLGLPQSLAINFLRWLEQVMDVRRLLNHVETQPTLQEWADIDEYILHEALERTSLQHDAIIRLLADVMNRGPVKSNGSTPLGQLSRQFINEQVYQAGDDFRFALTQAGLTPERIKSLFDDNGRIDMVALQAVLDKHNIDQGQIELLVNSQGQLADENIVKEIADEVSSDDLVRYLQEVAAGETVYGVFAGGGAQSMDLSQPFQRLGVAGLTPKILRLIQDGKINEAERAIDAVANGVIHDEEDISVVARQLMQLRTQWEQLIDSNPQANVSLEELLEEARFSVVVNRENRDAVAQQLAAIGFAGLRPENITILVQGEVGGAHLSKEGESSWHTEKKWRAGHGHALLAMKDDAKAAFYVTERGALEPLKKSLSAHWKEEPVKNIVFGEIGDLHLLDHPEEIPQVTHATRLMNAGEAQMVIEMIDNPTGREGGRIFQTPEGQFVVRDSIALPEGYTQNHMSRLRFYMDAEAFDAVDSQGLPRYLRPRQLDNGEAVITEEMFAGDITSLLNTQAMRVSGREFSALKSQSDIPEALGAIAFQNDNEIFKKLAEDVVTAQFVFQKQKNFWSEVSLMTTHLGRSVEDEPHQTILSEITRYFKLFKERLLNNDVKSVTLKLSQEGQAVVVGSDTLNKGPERKAKVGFYPIAGDPIHWAHILIAFKALAMGYVDVVVMRPQGTGSGKERLAHSLEIRKRIIPLVLKLLFGDRVVFSPLHMEGDNTDLIGEEVVVDFMMLNESSEMEVYYMVGEDHYQRTKNDQSPDTIGHLEAVIESGVLSKNHVLSALFIRRPGSETGYEHTADSKLKAELLPAITFPASSSEARRSGAERNLGIMPWTVYDESRKEELYGLRTPEVELELDKLEFRLKRDLKESERMTLMDRLDVLSGVLDQESPVSLLLLINWIDAFSVTDDGPLMRLSVPEESPAPTLESPLTAQEFEVAWRLANGLTNSEIAVDMELKRKTVSRYVSAIYRKLGVRRQPNARMQAIALLEFLALHRQPMKGVLITVNSDTLAHADEMDATIGVGEGAGGVAEALAGVLAAEVDEDPLAGLFDIEPTSVSDELQAATDSARLTESSS